MTRTITLDTLSQTLRKTASRRRVAIASPADDHTIEVATRAITEEVADLLLVVERSRAAQAEHLKETHAAHVTLYYTDTPEESAATAVSLVREGKADVLMKGTLNTDVLLRAVLDKQHGLLRPGQVLTHVAVAQTPLYPKPLMFSDAAVIPYPTLDQMDAILRYALGLWRQMSDGTPRVALIHCTEKTSEKFPQTIAYAELCRRAETGTYGEAFVSGPMDVKTACDAESARIKGIASPVVGAADMLLFPDIEAANTFYKTITLFADATVAGMLCGTTAPVVVASRADSADSKYHSLALACLASLA